MGRRRMIDTRIKSGLLLSLSDHLIHPLGAQDLPQLVRRMSALLKLLKQRINAFRASDSLLLPQHGLQKSAEKAGDLICGRSAASERR